MTEHEHIITCLGEEAVEVAKEVSKILRFGIDDVNFLNPHGPTNRERLIDELNDFMGAVQLLEDEGILFQGWMQEEKIRAKKVKIIGCMEYARSQGAVTRPWEERA